MNEQSTRLRCKARSFRSIFWGKDLSIHPRLKPLSSIGAQTVLKVIRKLKTGGYRLYSRKRNPSTGKRRNLGTFRSLAAARRHERAVQFFKRH